MSKNVIFACKFVSLFTSPKEKSYFAARVTLELQQRPLLYFMVYFQSDKVQKSKIYILSFLLDNWNHYTGLRKFQRPQIMI